jgi:hypothetical protein
MAWRVANSLITLRNQVNALYPNRSKLSDGTIGDALHAASVSDHNPNSAGVVTAFDITHDPANGMDIAEFSDRLAATRDTRIKYLIANRLIMVPADYGWTWVPYTGDDPHTNHLHISVNTFNYDDGSSWAIDPPASAPVQGEDMGRIEELEDLANTRQQRLDQVGALVSVKAPVDGDSFPLILNNIKAEQNRIDELTRIVGDLEKTSGKEALDKLAQIQVILSK